MKIKRIIDEILKLSPIELSEDHDNSGLQLGDTEKKLENILLSLDVSMAAIKKAKHSGANLIISHHPLIFRPLDSIDSHDAIGYKIISAVKDDICIYSSHTNFDSAFGGLNDILASRLGVGDTSPLRPHDNTGLCKLVVFTPKGYEKVVKDALFKIGAGHTGDYSRCSFSVEGEGTFSAGLSSNPFIGSKGRANRVGETRIETIIKRSIIDSAVKLIYKVHPYEEPAFDIYPLILRDNKAGLGRVGVVKNAMTLASLIKRVKQKLSVEKLRFVGKKDKKVKRVAVCTGSGSSLIDDAVASGADVFITGDIKYHEARYAEEKGIALIDAGHFPTEIIFVDFMKKYITRLMKESGSVAKVFTYKAADPFNTI